MLKTTKDIYIVLHETIVLMLLNILVEQCNVNIDSPTNNGNTPLMIASEKGNLDTVRDINGKTPPELTNSEEIKRLFN